MYRFCHLGDILNAGGGGAESSTVTNHRWMGKFSTTAHHQVEVGGGGGMCAQVILCGRKTWPIEDEESQRLLMSMIHSGINIPTKNLAQVGRYQVNYECDASKMFVVVWPR